MPGLNPTPGVPAAMAAVMAPAEQPHDAQVLVRFVTKLPLELRVPETQVVSWRAGALPLPRGNTLATAAAAGGRRQGRETRAPS